MKLQPPSDNKLPAFNPFLPPPAITQILLLSTADLVSPFFNVNVQVSGLKDSKKLLLFWQNLIELKYVVSFDMDGETTTEMGSVPDLSLCPVAV